MKKHYFCSALLALLLFANSAHAIDDKFETIHYDPTTNMLFGQTKKTEIFALDNFAEDAKSSGANLDVIKREDIKKLNTPSFADLLNSLGSVTVQNANGSEGSTSSVRIRGTDRVRMTIDGIRADRPSLTTPGVEPQFLLLDDIEVVEVIKGPQGNVSGTNASGGIIALQTRQGRGPLKLEVGSDMGTYGEFKERFAAMGGNDKADFYLSTTWFKNNGGMWTKNLGSIYNDDYNNLSVVSNLGMRLLDNKAEIRDIFRFSRARKGLGIGTDEMYMPYNDPNNYSTNYDIMNSLIFKHAPNEKYNYDAKFGLYHNQYNYYGLTDNLYSQFSKYDSLSDMTSTRLNFMTQHNFKPVSWNTLSLGYNLETEFIDGSNMERYNYGFGPLEYPSKYSGNTIQNDVYVNDVINIKDMLFLRGGARLINNSAYGTYVAPNASAALILPTFNIKGATTKFRGSWGYNVNTPTLYQRYGILHSSWMDWVGNPNLKAEKNWSWDVGIEQSFLDDKLKFEFGYFDSRYKDYISSFYDYDPVTWMSRGYYANIDRAHLRGFEGKATFEPNDKFKFIFNYTYTDAQDESTGLSLPSTPKNRFNGTIVWSPFERWSLYFGLEAATGRTMSSASSASVPGYVDAKIGTQIRLFSYKGADVFFRANIYNLFNQNICMYKDTYNNDYYYAPHIRFRGGIFIEYNLPTKAKEKV